MNISEFLPLFKLRSPNLMLFIGAGTSVSAGIPSASDINLDFKRTIYCAENRKPISYCQDLSNENTRAIIQNYFDKKGILPKLGSASEYADYFEALYPTEPDRRRYIGQLVEMGRPSYGHLVLAALMMMDKVRIVWTTNFDRTVEDATISLFKSSGKLIVANLDNAHITLQAINEARWPLLVKLHGDFQSNKLKNTSEELQAQDANLGHSLTESCKRYGLIVAGYSGRDKSVMDSLNLAVNSGTGFPSGLFWLVRPDNPPFDAVKKMINNAQSKGIDAHLIEVETFDEFMGDLLLLEEKLPDDIQNYLNQAPRRVSDATIRKKIGKWPVVRLNALRIKSWPNICRKIVCNIGGFKEMRNAIKESGANIIATRRNVGILLFGGDEEAKKAFSKYSIQDFDVHTILTDKFKYYDSQELGLLYEALALAISRETSLRIEKKHNSYYLVIPNESTSEENYQVLKKATYQVNGQIPNTEIKWSEAIRIKIEYKFDKLWLLINPLIWLDRPENATEEENDIADEFVREKSAVRYNNKMNDLLDGWINIIVGFTDSRQLSTFGIQDGVDATFDVSRGTAFSYME